MRDMCEHFIARAAEPFRLDELWPFAERLERYGIAGFGWGGVVAADGRRAAALASYRDVRAFRDDPGRERVGAVETTSALLHLRRPSRLSTLTLPDTQPFDDPAGRYAFSHNGDLRDYQALRRTYRAQGRIHGRADTEVGARWLEDAWHEDEPVGAPARRPARPVRRTGEPGGPRRGRVAVPLRGQRARTRCSRSASGGSASPRPASTRSTGRSSGIVAAGATERRLVGLHRTVSLGRDGAATTQA